LIADIYLPKKSCTKYTFGAQTSSLQKDSWCTIAVKWCTNGAPLFFVPVNGVSATNVLVSVAKQVVLLEKACLRRQTALTFSAKQVVLLLGARLVHDFTMIVHHLTGSFSTTYV
jgi:hypothetical protein